MRRLFALLQVLGGLTAVASPAAAQSAIAPLPSGVTLRVHGSGMTITGVLYQQSVDSVWVRARGNDQAVRGIATGRITAVEQAKPAYLKSVLVGTALGAGLGAVLYTVSAHNDHDIFVGFSVIAGAVAGSLFPHTDWSPVPLH